MTRPASPAVRAMRPADACEDCLTRDNPPHTTTSDHVVLIGAYRCRNCGHTWTCAWNVAALREVEFDHDAA